MAYTAPNDLFTSEEAILSLASSIADEDRTNLGNGTINGALDVLADALAERNVEVPPMNAGAILALAQYVSGGGGGGGATITVIELVGDDPADQPSFKVETIGGEQIDVASTTVVVNDVEMPAYTFNATAGDVIVISVTDENLTFNADSVGGSWYSSAFNLPRTIYPSLIGKQKRQMILVAASGDSCVFASLTSRGQ